MRSGLLDEAKEVWADIIGYEGFYKVSNYGRFEHSIWYSVSRTVNDAGFYIVNLRKDKKAKVFLAHRLVAFYFVDNPENKKIVGFKDNNKLNIHPDNLIWQTQTENTRQRLSSNFSNAKKFKCMETGVVFNSSVEAAEFAGVAQSTIPSSIYRGCKAGGYTWRRV